MNKKLYMALVTLLVTAFVGSAIYLGSYFLEGKKEADRYNELSNLRQEAAQAEASTAPSEATQGGETTANTLPDGNPMAAPENPDAEPLPEEKRTKRTDAVAEGGFLPGMKPLFEANDQIVGWLRIENSPIDYPVMQTSVNNKDYYLDHTFDKEVSIRGTLYVREECDVYRPSDNVTIYGHNMRDGSMFAYLGNYYDQEAWKENSLVFFDTLFESHVYKIFAVFKTSANIGEGFSYHKMVDAENEDDFHNFIANCKRLSFYDTGITPVYGDKIICMSTCEYTLDNGRFVVCAVRIS